jgi:hypothetical protein
MVRKMKNQNDFNFIENERQTTRPNLVLKKSMFEDKPQENIEAYDSQDEFGEGIYKGHKSTIHIHGGALAGNEIRGLLDASYDKGIKNVDGGWVQDDELSTGKTKVFYNPTTGKSSVVHRGTVGTLGDWSNNAIYAMGGETLYKTTDRYKQAKDVQKAAEQKYGRDNLTTLGHSQGGLQAELLGKKGDETITLNKATRPFSNTPSKNQTDIRTTTDLVSAMNPFSSSKNTESISLKGFNPLKAHATTSLKKLGNKMIGKGMYSDSDSESSSDEEYVPRKRGRPPKGGAIFGKIEKGFKKEIIKPTKQVVKQEVIEPTKEAVKYVSTKDGLATDLLYKGVPMALGTLTGVAGAMATGGPLGGVAGNYAGQMAGKMIAQKVGRETKMGSETQRGVGTKNKSSNKTVKKYFTSKKGGLSSDLLHRGVPTIMGGIGGVAGITAGGPIGGVMGSQAGSQAGQLATDYIGKKIGVGLFPQSKARKDYKAQQDLQKKYIGNTDNGQKYDVVETGYGFKRGRGRPEVDSVNIDIDFNSHNAGKSSKTMTGGKLKKGSPEMAEKMARLRALKNK